MALPGAHVSSTKLVKHVEYPGDPAPPLRVRADRHQPGPEQHRGPDQPQQAQGPGLHHPLRAQPRLLGHAQGAARRRDPPAPRRLAQQRLPTFAAGEEKTTFQLPRGYGYHYNPSDNWIMNYMIHNLTPKPTKVSITYDIDFVPDSSAAAAKLTPAPPALDGRRRASRAYPVFDALKGQGKNGKFTFPDQANGAQQDGHRPRARVHGHEGHDAARHRGPPAPRRALHGPEGHAATASARSCSARWPSTSSPPARFRGTSR